MICIRLSGDEKINQRRRRVGKKNNNSRDRSEVFYSNVGETKISNASQDIKNSLEIEWQAWRGKKIGLLREANEGWWFRGCSFSRDDCLPRYSSSFPSIPHSLSLPLLSLPLPPPLSLISLSFIFYIFLHKVTLSRLYNNRDKIFLRVDTFHSPPLTIISRFEYSLDAGWNNRELRWTLRRRKSDENSRK